MKADCVHKDIWREEGSYVNRGPFPKPETTVRVQELARDDDTGVTRLRLTPVNGDTLYADIGSEATTASKQLDGREYETDELRVSFLATDSTGEHDSGDPVEWTGRITLKSLQYLDGERRLVEIRAAPTADIRYTTDGSDPKVAGGAYGGAFAIPDGARLVLAYAEKDGVVSETHQREIAEQPVEKPIDKTQPATWAPSQSFEFKDRRTAYGFLARLQKHRGTAGGGLRISVQRTDNTWAELDLSNDLALSGDAIEELVEALRRLIADGEVVVEAKDIRFETGQDFLDYVADIRGQYKRDEVTP